MKKIKQYFPVIWYYIGWFGCVYLGKYGFSAWSFLFPLLLVVLLLAWRQLSLRATALLTIMAVFGMAFDALMAANGSIVFTDSDYIVLPYWLISIWILFLFIVPVMVPIFYSRLFLAAILGAIFGPLSYASGSAMKVLSFQGPSFVYWYAGFWALYFPLSIYTASKILLKKRIKNVLLSEGHFK